MKHRELKLVVEGMKRTYWHRECGPIVWVQEQCIMLDATAKVQEEIREYAWEVCEVTDAKEARKEGSSVAH